MKIVFTVLILVSLLPTIQLHAQEQDTAREKQEIVYQIPYVGTASDTIIDVVYGTARITVKDAMDLGVDRLQDAKITDIVVVRYPKVVMLGDTIPAYRELTRWIRFYDSNETMKSILELAVPRQKCIVSTNKKLIAIRNISSHRAEFDTMTIYDQEGTEMATQMIRNWYPVLLADDGSFVVYGGGFHTVLPPAVLRFYDPAGEIIKEVQTNSSFYHAKYTPDDRFFVLLITGHGQNMGPTTDMVCYNKNGDVLWRYNIADLRLNKLNNIYLARPYGILNFSDDSKEIHIRAGSDSKGDIKRMWIFNTKGELIEKKEGWER
jgi:hypothetical protein